MLCIFNLTIYLVLVTKHRQDTTDIFTFTADATVRSHSDPIIKSSKSSKPCMSQTQKHFTHGGLVTCLCGQCTRSAGVHVLTSSQLVTSQQDIVGYSKHKVY